MRLSRETRYAIEALLVLADHVPGEAVGGKQIAEESGLPTAFLYKILRQLTVGGVLTSRPGVGYALARGPGAITLAQIFDAMEGVDAFENRCIFWREDCSAENPCELHFRWREMKPQIADMLRKTTLAEIRAGEAPRRVGAG